MSIHHVQPIKTRVWVKDSLSRVRDINPVSLELLPSL